MDFTKPKETISRVKPGYFTDFNAFFTRSSEIVTLEPYPRCPRRKPCAHFAKTSGGSASPKTMARESPEAQISSGKAAISNALRTTRSVLPILIVQLVADLIIASPRWASRLLAGFRNEVWILPLRPVAVFRLHRIGWQMELKEPVCAARKL